MMAPHTDPREWPLYQKTAKTRAMQINRAEDLPGGLWTCTENGFRPQGTHRHATAPWGSWLAVDAEGTLYGISDSVMRKTYEPIVGFWPDTPGGPPLC